MSRALRRVRPTGFSNRACSGHTHTAMMAQRMVAANLTTSSGVIWMNTQEAAIAAPVTPMTSQRPVALTRLERNASANRRVICPSPEPSVRAVS